MSAVGVVIVAGTVYYYVRPSSGEPGNPDGAACRVADLRARPRQDKPRSPLPETPGDWWPPSSGLLCGYDNNPSGMVRVERLSPSLVRPYFDQVEYQRAAVEALLARESTERPRPVLVEAA
ncbi:MAG: hypothetical protein M3443_14220 [Actinomycetota bacterium]|nr:hypothetical protein [Actinomycetota bacterium]